MTAIVGWLVFPLVLGVLAFGCGLAVEAAARAKLPFALLLPIGFALIVCVTSLAALTRATALLATPAVVACAAAGFLLSPGRVRVRVWPLLAAIVVYVVYAAPTVLAGRSTFAGYIKLDDTATYLAMLDHVTTDGRGLSELRPSSYEATLATTLDLGYPLGSFVPLGVGQRLLDTDPAWLWQPYLAFLGALLALSLYALATGVVGSPCVRAAIAAVSAQPAILFGYSLWGGIKELAAAVLLVAAAATIPTLSRSAPQAAIALAVPASALVGVLSVGAVVWLVPLVLASVLVVVNARGKRFAASAAVVLAVAATALAVPSIVAAADWLPRSRGFTSAEQLGNLVQPLSWLQAVGIWPSGDFRRAPEDPAPAYVLIALAAIAAAAGLLVALRRRHWGIVTLAVTCVVATIAVGAAGSPWVAAKALASASPAVVLLALVAAAALGAARRPVEGSLLAAAVAGGVLWSNVLAYREVWLAPGPRLAELERIGHRFAGRGPALMTEFEPYGVRHFLRRLDAEGASELRRRLVALQSGEPLPPQAYADIDRFHLDHLSLYRTLVLRRSPVQSLPPASYVRVWRGRWYEVWQRFAGTPHVLDRLPLGNGVDPAAVPSCRRVVAFARRTGATRLVAIERPAVYALPLASVPHPRAWTPAGDGLYASSSGTVSTTALVRTVGEFGVWLGGSFLGRVSVTVDGRVVGRSRHQLQWDGQYVELGRVRLAAGRHRVALSYTAGGWRPGTKGPSPFPLGPLVLTAVREGRRVTVAASNVRALCGRRLDWIDAVAP